MTRDEAKKLIVNRVLELGGAKTIDLVTDLTIADIFTDFKFSELCNEMVADGSLLEFRFALGGPTKLNSFVVPGVDSLSSVGLRHGMREFIFM